MILLKIVDLPTLGLPTMATRGGTRISALSVIGPIDLSGDVQNIGGNIITARFHCAGIPSSELIQTGIVKE